MTASRFRGPRSGGGGLQAKPRSFSWRVLGLYIAPSALLLPGLAALLSADIPGVARFIGAWALLIFAARLTGQGLTAEAAYDAREIAKPPAFPRKLVAAALFGLIVFGLTWVEVDAGLLAAVFYGALAGGAHVLCFGPDPMKAKGLDGVSGAAFEQAAAKIEQAERLVAETVEAAGRLRDDALEARIDTLAYAARDILREIQRDPRDLRRARRFLAVHLVGLREATVKFAEARAKGAAADLRAKYTLLLDDLEASFAKQRETLLMDDKVDLEVEIEVLRDRLRQEGAI